MILVDIEIPVLGQTYDFQIDEHAVMRDLAAEVSSAVCAQKQYGTGDPAGLSFWDAEKKLRLPDGQTAAECGIHTGSKLILV